MGWLLFEGVGPLRADDEDADSAAVPTANWHADQAAEGQTRLDLCVWWRTVEEIPLEDVAGALEDGRQDAATFAIVGRQGG